MKVLAYAANAIFFVAVVVAIVDEFSTIDGVEWLFPAILLLFPFINVLALRSMGMGFVGMWLKRKRLEEKKRIDELSAS